MFSQLKDFQLSAEENQQASTQKHHGKKSRDISHFHSV
jgi:hypothetical protein